MNNFLNKILYILPSGKISLALLTLAFIFVSVLESLGIGLIGPYIALATDPSLIEKYGILNTIYNGLALESRTQFVSIVGFAIILISATRAFFSWWTQILIFKFGYRQQAKLITRLMNGYLKAPYTFYLSKNSAQIVQNVVIETKNFTARVLIPLLISISSLFVLIFLALLLFITNFWSIVVVLGIALPLFLFFNVFKTKVSQWGKDASLAEKALIGYVNDSVGSIKETRVIGCEQYFEDKIEQAAEVRAENMGTFYAYRQAPRYFVEALMIVFLIGFISIYLLFENDIASLTSTLSIFALSSIRIIPAANQIVGGVSNLKNSSFIVNKLYSDLKETERQQSLSLNGMEKAISPSSQRANRIAIHDDATSNAEISSSSHYNNFKKINLEAVSYRYPNAETDALKELSFQLKKGESIALIGKSGSGKTTLADVILGLLTPQSGDIKADGDSIYQDIRQWQSIIGYIPQSIYLTDNTIESNIAFGVPEGKIDHDRLQNAIEAAQLSELLDRLPDGVGTTVGERGVLLSGGQRQRIGIARALYHGREILVLDEATAALDNETERLVTDAINALSGKKTMIIIAHRLTTVENCDRIYLMKEGEIIQSGSYHDVVLSKDLYQNEQE